MICIRCISFFWRSDQHIFSVAGWAAVRDTVARGQFGQAIDRKEIKMSTIELENVESNGAPSKSYWARVTATLVGRIRLYLAKRRSRDALVELTRDQLADIGITPEEARAERQKSWFWS